MTTNTRDDHTDFSNALWVGKGGAENFSGVASVRDQKKTGGAGGLGRRDSTEIKREKRASGGQQRWRKPKKKQNRGMSVDTQLRREKSPTRALNEETSKRCSGAKAIRPYGTENN